MTNEVAEVSVVIPTSGRPEVVTAVQSALTQTVKPREIIVVFDGVMADLPEHLKFENSKIQVISTGRKSNANVARNLGIAAANSDYIALLDDDDTWMPTKLSMQLDQVLHARMLSCTSVTAVSTKTQVNWSISPMQPGQSAIDYLFAIRAAKEPPRVLQTSTWIAHRSLLVEFPFDESLTIHQDLDWLAKTRQRGVQVSILLEPLTRYRVAGADSVTKRSRWRESILWLSKNQEAFTAPQEARFILMLPQSFAARNGESKDAWRLILSGLRRGWPGTIPLAMAIRRAILATVHRA